MKKFRLLSIFFILFASFGFSKATLNSIENINSVEKENIIVLDDTIYTAQIDSVGKESYTFTISDVDQKLGTGTSYDDSYEYNFYKDSSYSEEINLTNVVADDVAVTYDLTFKVSGLSADTNYSISAIYFQYHKIDGAGDFTNGPTINFNSLEVTTDINAGLIWGISAALIVVVIFAIIVGVIFIIRYNEYKRNKKQLSLLDKEFV